MVQYDGEVSLDKSFVPPFCAMFHCKVVFIGDIMISSDELTCIIKVIKLFLISITIENTFPLYNSHLGWYQYLRSVVRVFPKKWNCYHNDHMFDYPSHAFTMNWSTFDF